MPVYRFRMEDKDKANAKISQLMDKGIGFEVCQPVEEEIEGEPSRYFIDIVAAQDED